MAEQIFWKRFIGAAVFLWLSVMFLPLCAGAAEIDRKETGFSIGLSAGVHPFISGKAGTGAGAPDYGDLFKIGYGFSLELEQRINDEVSLLASAGYQEHSGETYKGMAFGDLEIIPFYIGCKFHISTGSLLKASVGTRIGAAYLSSVDVSWNSFKENYWDSSWVPTGDIGFVLERQINNWNFSAGVSVRYTGAPDNNLTTAEAEGFWTIPIQVNIRFYF